MNKIKRWIGHTIAESHVFWMDYKINGVWISSGYPRWRWVMRVMYWARGWDWRA